MSEQEAVAIATVMTAVGPFAQLPSQGHASARATAGRVCLVARSSARHSEAPVGVEHHGAGGAGGSPPAPPGPEVLRGARVGGEMATAVAVECFGTDAEAPVCDYLYPPVCRQCCGVLGRYVNLPRLVCGTCDSVGPIAPLPEDYLGCTRCRFFVCAHCIEDLAAGRTLALCAAGEDPGHTAVAATGAGPAAAEGDIARSEGASAAADSGAPERARDAAISGDSASDTDSSSDSAVSSDAAGLVQMTCTIPAQQSAAAEAPAPAGSAAQRGGASRVANEEATWRALRQTAIDRALALIGDPSDIATRKRRKALVHAALCQAVARVGLPQGRCPADFMNDEFKQSRFLQVLAVRDRTKQAAASTPPFGGATSGVSTGMIPEGNARFEPGTRGAPDTPVPRHASITRSCRSCGRVVCGTVALTPAGSELCHRRHGLPEKLPGGGQAPGSSTDGGGIVVDTPSPTPRRSTTPNSSDDGVEPCVDRCAVWCPGLACGRRMCGSRAGQHICGVPGNGTPLQESTSGNREDEEVESPVSDV